MVGVSSDFGHGRARYRQCFDSLFRSRRRVPLKKDFIYYILDEMPMHIWASIITVGVQTFTFSILKKSIRQKNESDE